MSSFYQNDLDRIRDSLVLMGEKAVDLVRFAVHSLETSEPEVARRVRHMDDEVDALEKQIDSEAIRYISLRAPVASDLRLLTVAMKACHDLERVGDEASSIAKRVERIAKEGPARQLHGIPTMAAAVLEQLRDALDSFIDEDIEKAYSVPHRDRDVDDLNRENYNALTEAAQAGKVDVDMAIGLIFISKSLERIGDHATNIAEEVIYLLEGDDIRHTEAVKRSLEAS